MPPMACKFCKWCAGEGEARRCRYSPPRATGFPRVGPNDFCSKFQADEGIIKSEIERRALHNKKKAEIAKALNPK